jgi:hypothetical protein
MWLAEWNTTKSGFKMDVKSTKTKKKREKKVEK